MEMDQYTWVPAYNLREGRALSMIVKPGVHSEEMCKI
jgi:hypothetical protein